MASTISAGTSAGTAIAITGDTTGNLAFTTQAGTYTQTLPNATGTVMVSGNMPAFSAYLSANQTISNNTATKVALNIKSSTGNSNAYDTNGYFDATTNYRFTPLIAGYYQVNAGVYFTGTAMTNIQLYIYKNGSNYQQNLAAGGISVSNYSIATSATIYFNGSTDYVELWGYSSAASGNAFGGGSNLVTYMSGSMIRSL